MSSSFVPLLGNPFYSDRKLSAEGKQICVQEKVVVASIKTFAGLFSQVGYLSFSTFFSFFFFFFRLILKKEYLESVSDIVNIIDCSFEALVQILLHAYGGAPNFTGNFLFSL